MTLPSTIQLPLHSDFIKSENKDDLEKYMRELVYSLQTMYEDLAGSFNGAIRSDTETQRNMWKPTLNGSVSGTFTYSNQTGWVFRQGLWVDVWGDVTWTATTATGNLFVELPYIVARTLNMPYVGVVQPSSLAFTGGTEVVINGMSNTYRGEFWNTGDAFATANQSVTATGRLIFHLRYLSQDDETA
jgi:hypothetical protein